MPLYEYKCDLCGDVFEVMQKFSDAPLTIHEKCGGAIRRLISAPALQFKGSGWYITDYARSGGSDGRSKNGSSTSSPEAKTETSGKSNDTPAKS
jgi:putative FmdB family regulatory protein